MRLAKETCKGNNAVYVMIIVPQSEFSVTNLKLPKRVR